MGASAMCSCGDAPLLCVHLRRAGESDGSGECGLSRTRRDHAASVNKQTPFRSFTLATAALHALQAPLLTRHLSSLLRLSLISHPRATASCGARRRDVLWSWSTDHRRAQMVPSSSVLTGHCGLYGTRRCRANQIDSYPRERCG